jgi:CHRD domain
MKRYLLGIAIGILAVSALVATQTALSAKPTKTTICHRTHSGKKPYVKITVGKSVLKGHLRHAQDIIPAPATGCPTTVLSPEGGGVLLTSVMNGHNEVPAADLDGTGTAWIRLQAGEAKLCFKLAVQNILLPATGAHVHLGATGINGPIVVPLTPPDATGMSQGCVNVSRTLVGQILANPAGYYANVHTTDFPAGAIRGALG